jgi:hypothetical protein
LIDTIGAYQNTPSEAYREVDYHPSGWKVDLAREFRIP